METGAIHKELASTSPLSTISPRRTHTAVSTRSSNSSGEDKKLEEEVRRQEDKILQELRARDREVRAHEAAHVAAGRPHILSGPSYVFQEGPDGRSYAIGGEVHLDISEVSGDPEATLRKAEKVHRAALAPTEPSPQDMRVAANASQMAAQARVELAAFRREEASGSGTAEEGTSRPPGRTISNLQLPVQAVSTFSLFV